MRIDICANEERHEVEEWHPQVVGQKLLGEREGDGAGDPADFHDGHEACADGGADLMEGSRAGYEGHTG